MKVVLSIAGSDSGGGAGVQADLKTFAALGVFGTSAITAITAQNSVGVRGVYPLLPEAVAAQIDAVSSDMKPAAVKIGMLGNAALVRSVAEALDRNTLANVVLDPVMVAASGDPLLEPDAIGALVELLLPRCTLLTPNLPEAEMLLDRHISHDDRSMMDACRALRDLGAHAVLLKAGHREGDADDVFVGPRASFVLEAERIQTKCSHGTGCTLSSAIAAFLGRGKTLEEAVRGAKSYVTHAIEQGYQIGAGQGVLHHFWEYYGREGLP